MSFISYAQNFEDVMLWRAFKEVQGGFYIDIGAQDPIVDSVSKAFYEKGWRGIHVEALPGYVKALKKDRPDEQILHYAVCDEKIDKIDFYQISNTGISTGDPDIAAVHKQNGFKVRKIQVPCIQLSTVFDIAGDKEIHWLKIDVEGMERNVLSSWGEHVARPQVVVVESTVPLTQIDTSSEWKHLLTERDYQEVYFDGLNRFFLHKKARKLKPVFKTPPNVFDDFSLSGTANSSFSLFLNQKIIDLEKQVDELKNSV